MGQPRGNLLSKTAASPEAGKVGFSRCTCPICKKTVAESFIRSHVIRVHKLKCYQCKICGKDVQTAKLLTKHYKTDHEGEKAFTCELCGTKLSTPFSYRIHKKLHAGEKTHHCYICNKRYVLKSQLNRHLKRHNGSKQAENSCKLTQRKDHKSGNSEFKCNTCGKIFRYKSSFKYHLRIHTGEKPHQCDMCGKCFNTPSLFNRHLEIHKAKKSYICDKCGKFFPGPIRLQSHINKYHISTGQILKCEVCGKILHGPSSYKYHIESKTCLKRFKCSFCSNAYSKDTDLQKHLETHSNSSKSKWYECDVCNKVFNKRSNLRIHEKIHSQDKPFKCQICSKSFINNPKLLRHQSTHTKGNAIEEGEEELENYVVEQSAAIDTLASMDYMNLEFNNKTIINNKTMDNNLLTELSVVDKLQDDTIMVPSTTYTADSVEQTSSMPPDVTVSDDKSCLDNDLQDFLKDVLQKHQEAGESKISNKSKEQQDLKMFNCENCGKCLHGVSSFKYHIESKTCQKRFACTICNVTYHKELDLRKHNQIHLQKSSRLFECEICSKVFKKKDYLRSHLKTHSINRDFSCLVCGKGFINKSKLSRHSIVHKRNRSENKESSGNAGKVDPCSDCDDHHKDTCPSKEAAMETVCHLSSSCNVQNTVESNTDNAKTYNGQTFCGKHEVVLKKNTKMSQNIYSPVECDNMRKHDRVSVNCDTEVTVSDQVTKNKSELQEHRCDVCGKCFRTVSTLKRHMSLNACAKQIICEVCHESFTKHSDFEKHITVHDEKSELELKVPSNFINHQLIVHKNEDSVSENRIEHDSELEHVKVMGDNQLFFDNDKKIDCRKRTAFKDQNIIMLSEESLADTADEVSTTNNTAIDIVNNQDLSQNMKSADLEGSQDTVDNTETPSRIQSGGECDSSDVDSETLSNNDSVDTVPYSPHNESCTDKLKDGPVNILEEEKMILHDIKETGSKCSSSSCKGGPVKADHHNTIGISKEKLKQKKTLNKGKKVSVVCDICGKTLHSRSSLSGHLRRHSSTKMYICEICGKQFRDKVYHKEHVLTHTGESDYKCTTCGMAFISQRKLIIHTRKHTGEKPYICEVCGKAYDDHSRLKSYLLTHANDEEKPHKCLQCKKGFVSKTKLNRHIRTHTGERPFKCQVCQKGFLDKSDLTSHINSHKQEKTFECEVCGKFLKTKSSYRSHVESHSGVKNHICEICGRGFQFSSNLRRHKRTHTGEKTVKCPDCGMMFSEKSRLQSHSVIHREDRPYKCDKCEKSFKRPFGLKSHIENQHDLSEKFRCEECNQCFPGASELRQHTRNQHASGFPYHCDICRKGFDKKNNCKTHMMLVHTNERPFKCKICSKGFINSSKLERHNITHTKLKPFECELCGNKYNVLSNLQYHMKKHHTSQVQPAPFHPSAIDTVNTPKVHVLVNQGVLNESNTSCTQVVNNLNVVNEHNSLQIHHSGSDQFNVNETNIVMFNNSLVDHLNENQFLYVNLQNAVSEVTVTM